MSAHPLCHVCGVTRATRACAKCTGPRAILCGPPCGARHAASCGVKLTAAEIHEMIGTRAPTNEPTVPSLKGANYEPIPDHAIGVQGEWPTPLDCSIYTSRNKRESQQDTAFARVVPPGPTDGAQSILISGILDGHGDEAGCATFVAKHLVEILTKYVEGEFRTLGAAEFTDKTLADVTAQMKTIFEAVDEAYFTFARNWGAGAYLGSGSTASVAIFAPMRTKPGHYRQIIVTVGDSPVILLKSRTDVAQMSIDDTTAVPEERARVDRSVTGRVGGDGGVYVTEEGTDKTHNSAITRAFGNVDYKREALLSPMVVTPRVAAFEVAPGDISVLCSDGVFPSIYAGENAFLPVPVVYHATSLTRDITGVGRGIRTPPSPNILSDLIYDADGTVSLAKVIVDAAVASRCKDNATAIVVSLPLVDEGRARAMD